MQEWAIKEKLSDENHDIHKIPVFNRVTDKETISELEEKLASRLEGEPLLINLSELDIVGVTEVFRSNDSSFEIKYGRQSERMSDLDSEKIRCFIARNRLKLFEGLQKVRLVSYCDGAPVRTDFPFNLIDYIDEEKRCILLKGKWYYFNDDYLDYLKDSLAEIEVTYDQQYDYSTELHNQFIEEIKKRDSKYAESRLRGIYYREWVYNLYISENYSYECYDRNLVRIHDYNVELMDLYKDKTLYTVKIGKSSSGLCYAVEQSTNALKVYKHSLHDELPEIERFGIWLVLDRSEPLQIVDGKPDINELKMLPLKNKLDAWKKEVRLLGYVPTIRINYFNLAQKV